ncbi:CRISPR-associated endonuclease Cas1 [Candidatus Symbiobacter mobilis]|uniref:CRISPR-associated endonuclease Cas1 n=1 Tax=Candidatus Symbiobacter mobilis CR TaxID=946483 RepID=U5N9L1_9BURK|nr:CRISPR-associated endonuclease Cas1 [Candidatus Symbiobacter mobilis]AGX86928.1 DNA repair protein [Candidatus Symbiobacter mobilis CR]
MALLVLDRTELDIRVDGDALALYESGTRRGTVPIKLMDRCVIHGARTKLDTGVLQRLAEAGVTTVLISPRAQRRAAIVLGNQHNDAAVRIAQALRVMNQQECWQWSAGIVRAKLARQRKTLSLMQQERPDARKPLFDAIQTIDSIQAHLREFGATTGAVASIRGWEGAAARAYFAALGSVFPPALGFAGRNRRPPKDPVNVCLSLSYTMLHAQAIQQCTITGLDPMLGFYHRPAFGRESLASDLIEPLRPAVDAWVWELLRKRVLREDHFSTNETGCMMGKAGRQIYYTEWEENQKPWQRWLRAQCQNLAKTLRNKGSLCLAE